MCSLFRRGFLDSSLLDSSVRHQKGFNLHSMGSLKRVGTQNTPRGAFIREIGSPQLLHVIPGLYLLLL